MEGVTCMLGPPISLLPYPPTADVRNHFLLIVLHFAEDKINGL